MNEVVNNIFDLVNYDIWGPLKSPTIAGHSYFVTLIDDKLSYIWIYLLKNKNHVLHIVPKFFKLIETQFSKSLPSRLFDRTMHQNIVSKIFFATTGTMHKFSCVHTLQQNFSSRKETPTPS